MDAPVQHHSRSVGTEGPVLIVGTGLLGTSIGLALRAADVEVFLSDTSPVSERLAVDMGAGHPISHLGGSEPRLVIVAAPPDVTAGCVAEALRLYPDAIVTDVASVKTVVFEGVENIVTREGREKDLARYVGSHPMAGRERSGAGAADADLFIGRPWVVIAHALSASYAILKVRMLATDLGAVPLEMDAHNHDESVALVSHVPQLVSSLLAARLSDAPSQALSLAGQGLRDTTRIAASDPGLWTAILALNARPVIETLKSLALDLQDLITHLTGAAEHGILEGGSVGAVNHVIEQGNEGVARIPGKHGGAPRRFAEVEVLVPDKPGELGRLFTELGEARINIEDLSLDHSAGQPVGLARIMVNPGQARDAERELETRGWRIIAHTSAV